MTLKSAVRQHAYHGQMCGFQYGYSWTGRKGNSIIRDMYEYTVITPTGVVFEGKDFSPSPLYCEDDKRVAASLLFFVSLQPQDTDEEYFANYTPEQRAWAESWDCENAMCRVSELEERLNKREVA